MYMGDSQAIGADRGLEQGGGSGTTPIIRAVDVATAYTLFDAAGNEPYPVLQGLGFAPLILPAVSAVASLLPSVTSLISGKKHYSPWGFLIDDYPDNIVANEVRINQLQGQLAQMMRQPPPQPYTPAPGFEGHKGSDAWQATMRPLIHKYAPGYDQYVASYARPLVDGYQQTYQQQLNIIQGLTQQLGPMNAAAINASAYPASGSAAVSPMNPLPNIYPYNDYNAQFPGVSVPYTPSPQALPSPFSPSSGGGYSPGGGGGGGGYAGGGGYSGGIFSGDMSSILLIGFGALAFILLLNAQRNAPEPATAKKKG